MQPISIRLSEDLQNYFENNFESKTNGVRFACESFQLLHNLFNSTMRGMFTSKEIHAIVDNLNGCLPDPRFMHSPSMLIAHLEDGDNLEGLSIKWEIDFNSLTFKISRLNQGQCFFLQFTVFSFWNQNIKGNAKSIDEYFDLFIQ